MPHAVVENRAFRSMFRQIRPQYKLPTRRTIAEVLLPEKFHEVEVRVLDEVSRAEFVSISCDGWTDVAKNAIINFIVYTPTPFLYNSVDTGSVSHSGKSNDMCFLICDF